jgi:DNA repair protein RadA/Sms
MTKSTKNIFVCQSCGYQTLKWMGRCPECAAWNSMLEEVPAPVTAEKRACSAMTEPQSIADISITPELRLKTGIAEFDRTLGGGVVPGSLVLIGGDPGIGKSTLILQILDSLSRRHCRALYLSGEESPQQIKLRAERLSLKSDGLFVTAGTCLEELFEKLDSVKPDLLAVDSIQTIYTEALTAAPGSVGQIRATASRLMGLAKQSQIPVFLVGHVTKEGAIAGPKVLEHLVDTVLYFEGDQGQVFRILRAVKNRYGSTNEIGVFEMQNSGLAEVGNPSRIFLQERPHGVSGSVVMPCIEGTRPVLVEIQALVGPSPLGIPRRTAVGLDPNRISLLVAVLSKRLGIELGDQDIFVNVAGGLKIEEPACDLAIVTAVISSFLDRPVDRDLVVFGEVGLTGELRGVNQPELRIKEAHKLGFSRCLLSRKSKNSAVAIDKFEQVGIQSIQGLYDLLFS